MISRERLPVTTRTAAFCFIVRTKAGRFPPHRQKQEALLGKVWLHCNLPLEMLHKKRILVILRSYFCAILSENQTCGVNQMEFQAAAGSPDNFFRARRHLFLLALIALLSFGLNFYAISKMGYGNAYYAAAIRSMTESLHNFFFVSFDPAGLVSVDKPPLGLWIQALFVLVFGYHGWAMLLPQALAGTGACLLMHALTAKHFGRTAGLVAALVFALTPAVVVAARNNTMDMQLIFVLLLAAWFLFRAMERASRKDLFLSALLIGLGFNIKMLQAYLILPAVILVYLFFSKEQFSRRIVSALISALILFAVSFSWVAAVDLTPASSRPYVGSSTDNTVLELIIGHNGMERIYGGSIRSGQSGGTDNGRAFGGANRSFADGQTNPRGGETGQNPNLTGDMNETNPSPQHLPGPLDQAGNGQGMSIPGFGGQNNNRFWPVGFMGGGGAGNDIGTAGILRLWGSSLYGQISWLIVLALFCIAVKLRKIDWKTRTLRQGIVVFWVLWLAAMYGFFSFAGFWHRYYLCMLAPAIAGLAGIGFVDLIRAFAQRRGIKQLLLPFSLLATIALQILYVRDYTALRAWLAPLITAAACAGLILMAVHYFRPRRLVLSAAAGCMLLSILAAPLYWSLTAVLYVPQNVTMPYAGPELASTTETPGMTPNQETFTTTDTATQALEDYLVAHYQAGSYLVVSQRANDVAQFIVDTGLPAVAYGGFLGTDNAMTRDQLKELVQEGKVTYFMITGQNRNSNSDLISYVRENATLIQPSEYAGTEAAERQSGTSSSVSLYLFQ